MRRTLPLHMMAPGASLDGMTLAEGALSPSEVVQRIKEAMEPPRDDAGAILEFVYPVPGYPPPNAAGTGVHRLRKFSLLVPLF